MCQVKVPIGVVEEGEIEPAAPVVLPDNVSSGVPGTELGHGGGLQTHNLRHDVGAVGQTQAPGGYHRPVHTCGLRIICNIKLMQHYLTCSTPREVDIHRGAVMVDHIFVSEWKNALRALNCEASLMFTKYVRVDVAFISSLCFYQSSGCKRHAFFSSEACIFNLHCTINGYVFRDIGVDIVVHCDICIPVGSVSTDGVRISGGVVPEVELHTEHWELFAGYRDVELSGDRIPLHLRQVDHQVCIVLLVCPRP